MANPSRGWDRIPVYGWWSDNPGVPSSGQIDLAMDQRVRRADGRMIYPGGARRSLTIGKPEDQDPEVRAQVKAAMKALAAAEQGEDFDETAWEARWDQNLAAAIFTSFWAADDPDITPHGAGDDGYHVRVVERLDRASGKQYDIQPLIAHLSLPVPGINLADIDVPPGAPSAPAPIYAKGQPGGIAALNALGAVVNAFGEEVGALDEEQVGDMVGTQLADPESPAGVVLRSTIGQEVVSPLLAGSPPPARPGRIISRFQAGHGWSPALGAWTDTTDPHVYGSQAWRVDLAVSSTAVTVLELPAPVDIEGKSILVTATFDNPANVGTFEVHFASSAAAYNDLGRYAHIAPRQADPAVAEYLFSWDRYEVAAGTPDPKAMLRCRLRLQSNTGGPLAATIHEVRIIDPIATRFPNGVGTLSADDGYASQWLMYETLSKYGVPGTIFAIAENATQPDRLTVADLHHFQTDGWDVQAHAYALTTQNFVEMDPAALDADMRALKVWLASNGFAHTFVAYPQGAYNPTVIDIVKRYFRGARSVYSTPFDLPGVRPYQIAAMSVNPSNTVADVTNHMDRAVAGGVPFHLVWHRFEPGGPTVVPLSWGQDQLDAVVQHAITQGYTLTTYPDIYA